MSALRMLVLASSLLAGTNLASAANLASGETLEVKIKLKTADDELKRLWDRFGGWCAIAEWHPAVRSCTEGKEGDAVYRTLSLVDGGKIKEKLLALDPLTYRYAIVESPLPVKNYEAQFSMVPDKAHNDEVDVVWTASYDAADGKTDADARKAIDGIFKDGIASIKAKVQTIPDAPSGADKPSAP
jgi:hypothetical protein